MLCGRLSEVWIVLVVWVVSVILVFFSIRIMLKKLIGLLWWMVLYV